MSDTKPPEGGQYGPVWPVAGMAVTVGVTPVLPYYTFSQFQKARAGAISDRK